MSFYGSKENFEKSKSRHIVVYYFKPHILPEASRREGLCELHMQSDRQIGKHHGKSESIERSTTINQMLSEAARKLGTSHEDAIARLKPAYTASVLWQAMALLARCLEHVYDRCSRRTLPAPFPDVDRRSHRTLETLRIRTACTSDCMYVWCIQKQLFLLHPSSKSSETLYDTVDVLIYRQRLSTFPSFVIRRFLPCSSGYQCHQQKSRIESKASDAYFCARLSQDSGYI